MVAMVEQQVEIELNLVVMAEEHSLGSFCWVMEADQSDLVPLEVMEVEELQPEEQDESVEYLALVVAEAQGRDWEELAAQLDLPQMEVVLRI